MRGARKTRLVAAAALAGAVLALPLAVSNAAPAVVFRNDFTADVGGFEVVTGQRIIGSSNYGTGELSDFTATNHSFSDGSLVITPSKSETGAWNSTRLESSWSWAAPAGGALTLTGRLKFPTGALSTGLWPAFWMLGDGQWPGGGEVDLMEQANGESSVAMTLHCDVWTDATRGACNEPDGISAVTPVDGDWHTYSARIDRTVAGAEFFSWSVDGVERHRVDRAALPAEVFDKIVSNSYRVIINVAVGGAFPNKKGVSNELLATLPPGPKDSMLVDWVEVAVG